MKEPEDHHYVPKVYLKQFADSEKQFFVLNIKFNSISKKSVTQVCYLKNHFKIQRDETIMINNIDDPLYIEKKLFAQYENLYERLLRKMTFPSLHSYLLDSNEVRFFLEILLTIKRRNPTMRARMQTDAKRYFNSEQLWNDMAPFMDIARKIDSIDPAEYMRGYIGLINNDRSKLDDIYLQRFLGEQKLVSQIVDTLMGHRIFVYHASPGLQFITSDNPGFTSVNDVIFNVGGLSEDFIYAFPLSPQHCLIIQGKDKFQVHKTKQIHALHVGADAVDILNKSTSVVAMERLLAYSRDGLKQFMRVQG